MPYMLMAENHTWSIILHIDDRC